jgi:hypothetical protein
MTSHNSFKARITLRSCGLLARVEMTKAHPMTIQFEKLKARLLANPKVKAKYDALAPEFEIAAELLRARRGRTKPTTSLRGAKRRSNPILS